MKAHPPLNLVGGVLAAGAVAWLSGCSQITHVPPGQSVAFSTAPKAEFVADPPAAPAVAVHPEDDPYFYGPPVEPELPTADFTLPEELAEVADAESYVTRGSDYLAAGKTQEAIEALEKAVELEPNFRDAWRNLALAYESANQPEKAVAAFRNYKKYAAQ